MNEKELLSQLHKLKELKPDQEWKNSNRDILLAQISSGAGVEKKTPAEKLMNIFAWRNLEWVTEPVGVMAVIIIIVAGGAMGSVFASKNAKPGDSLYIAKILSERTKQAMTFSETEKAKLGIEFASNRAQELSEVKDESRAEKLENDFKNEIRTVKTRLEKLANKKPSSSNDSDNEVFSADSGKDAQGIQVSAGSTANQMPSARVILEEAEKLFDQKDYQGTLDKLEEANKAIDQSADKQTDPAATSTK